MLLEPEFIGIDDAVRVSDLSRSEIYRRLAAGQLKAVRGGRKTLIVYESFKEMCRQMREEQQIKFTPPPRTQEDKARQTEEILRGL
jgi:hypothetical protein